MQIELSLVIGIIGAVLGAGSMFYARAQARATRTQASGSVAAINWQGGASALRLSELWRELSEIPILLEEILAANPQLRPNYERLGARTVLLLHEYFNLVHATWHLRKMDMIPDYRWPSFEAQARIIAKAETVRS